MEVAPGEGADDRIVSQTHVVELVAIAMEDRDGADLIRRNVALVAQECDLVVEGSASGVGAMLGGQGAVRLIPLQDVSRFLVADQLQSIVDQDKCDPPVEGIVHVEFPTRPVELFCDGNDRAHGLVRSSASPSPEAKIFAQTLFEGSLGIITPEATINRPTVTGGS